MREAEAETERERKGERKEHAAKVFALTKRHIEKSLCVWKKKKERNKYKRCDMRKRSPEKIQAGRQQSAAEAATQ